MASSVDNQRRNNGKTPGGCTGKGFMPGQSGNPAGRPKCETIGVIFRRLGSLPAPTKLLKELRTLFPKEKNITLQEAALLSVYVAAVRGAAWAINFIAERTEGKPQESLIEKQDNSGDIMRWIQSQKERINYE